MQRQTDEASAMLSHPVFTIDNKSIYKEIVWINAADIKGWRKRFMPRIDREITIQEARSILGMDGIPAKKTVRAHKER